MLVFGDAVRAREPRAVLVHLLAELDDVEARVGLARHAALVGAFVDAGELAQGLADHAFEVRGEDARDPVTDAAMTLLVTLAREIARSWSDGFASTPAAARRACAVLAREALPDVVRLRRAEGHAFYAVYPEAYLAAAIAARAHASGPRHVIGIRSIGAGLAAMVAIGTRSPLPATVRPHGEPFRRRIAVAPELARTWTADPTARIAIVDEGPGMSGSSFGAVADLLEMRGIPATRIECFPSHPGAPGVAASEPHQTRWHRLRRHVVEVDALVVAPEPVAPAHRLATWIGELVAPEVTPVVRLDGPLEDLSAGAWRTRRFVGEPAWPASVVHQERRKLLARIDGTGWLARFVGLGRHGQRAAARARTLHAAGFTIELAGWCHGFLVERWHDDAAVLVPNAIDRGYLLERVGSYLGFRARAFPANPERGASPGRLLEMARRNTHLALGDAAAATLDRWAPRLAQLAARTRRIEIDGRLHTWEWLVTRDGLFKTDAIDHHDSHDLVGCQDLTWDLAGAAIELGISPDEEVQLAAIVARITGQLVDPELQRFARPCYLAFQLGRHALAISSVPAAEATRLRVLVDRYAALLRATL